MDRAADRRSGTRNRTERGISDRSPSLCFLYDIENVSGIFYTINLSGGLPTLFFVLSGKQKNGIRIPVLKNSIRQNSQIIIVKYVKINKNEFDK